MSYLVSITDSFRDALFTLKGSVIGKPEYGTILPLLKHRPFNSEWLIDFRRCLKDACEFDNRIDFKSAEIDTLRADVGIISYKVYITDNVIKGVVNV